MSKDNSNQSKASYLKQLETKISKLEEELAYERQIRLSMEQKLFYLNSILRRLPGNVFWKDIHGMYLGCNDNVLKMAGVDDIIGKTDFEMPWKEQAEEIRAHDERVIQSNRTIINIDESPTLHSGEKRVYRATKAPLKSESGEIVGIVGISYDITSEKEAEKLKEDMGALQERTEAIRLIGTSMAHELRTPLRAILSGAEGISRKLPTLLDAYELVESRKLENNLNSEPLYPRDIHLLRKALENIRIEANEAFSVIDMLLIKSNLSKIDRKKFVNLDIYECIEKALLRYPFQQEDRRMIFWEKTGNFNFHGDKLLTVHILFNLIKNAIYYVKAASKGNIIISTNTGEYFNELIFMDTGTGIPTESLEKIFDEFYTTTAHGTGVGLTFCRLIMSNFGGEIKCISKENYYTKFILSFPVLS